MVGSLSLNGGAVRASGVSPLAVFFDATATTSTASSKPFSDIQYSWNFGDTGASGTGKWAYGSNPNNSSKNTATGAVAAHVYVTGGVDQVYTVTLTAFDGTNTASCQIAVTAFDPSGPNGYPASATTCVSSSGVPAPGLGGCPLGANVANQSNYATALSSYLRSGKRVLFKCGDTFTGDNAVIAGSVSNFSIGAYGGCEGTTGSRPIFQATGSSSLVYFTYGNSATSDGRISDIDCEGNGYTPDGCVNTMLSGSNANVPFQITMLNLYSNGQRTNYSWAQGAQMALVDSVATGMNGSSIGNFINSGENNPAQWSASGSHDYMAYQAVIGSSFDGTGHTYTGGGQETVRVSACRKCYIANSTFKNANNIGAVLKIHEGNTYNSSNSWVGVFTEQMVISDNWFGGTSGANLVEVAPQNGGVDERLRDIVVERNLFSPAASTGAGRALLLSGQDMAARDNAFNVNNMDWGIQIAQRSNYAAWPTQNVDSYNNTCYSAQSGSYKRCVIISNTTMSGTSAITGSAAQNNLAYFPSSSGAATVQDAFANTVSNNTGNVASNPGFTNASTAYSIISDFKPQANYAGGTSVPNWYDAVGAYWPQTWDLGALHH